MVGFVAEGVAMFGVHVLGAPRHPERIPYGTTCHMGYHMHMARREVLVQLEDDLVDRLDRLAKTLGTNRSELLRRGARAIIDAEDALVADRELVAAYRLQPPEPALVRSAVRLAARTAPEW